MKGTETNENEKNIGLKIAIVLTALLLVVVVVMGIMGDRERLPVATEVHQEERVQEVQPAPPPGLRELEETEFRQEFKEEEIPAVRLEDTPFERIIEEEREALEEERGALDIVPSPEELKRIKEEGAVIH